MIESNLFFLALAANHTQLPVTFCGTAAKTAQIMQKPYPADAVLATFQEKGLKIARRERSGDRLSLLKVTSGIVLPSGLALGIPPLEVQRSYIPLAGGRFKIGIL